MSLTGVSKVHVFVVGVSLVDVHILGISFMIVSLVAMSVISSITGLFLHFGSILIFSSVISP